MNERNEWKALYGAVVFGIIAAAAVFLFALLSHWDDKTGEVKTEDTEETKAEDYGAVKTENAEQAEIAKEVFPEEDGAEDDRTEDEVIQRLRNVDWENVEV